MRIPYYWVKGEYAGTNPQGQPQRYAAWGWSDVSREDALSLAVERARASCERDNRSSAAEYDLYLNVPLREEVTERVNHAGEEIAAVTRNRYGSLVLNTAGVMFVDVDLPKRGGGGLLSLFSRKKREEAALARHERVVNRIVDWSLAHPGHAFRLYQTFAGYRLLFTDRLYDPLSEEVQAIFDGLGTDRLYRVLTRRQECFRARLTPKYWRLGEMKSDFYPRYEHQTGQRMAWNERYQRASSGFRVCTLVDVFGPASEIPPQVAAVVELHDATTRCAEDQLPLA